MKPMKSLNELEALIDEVCHTEPASIRYRRASMLRSDLEEWVNAVKESGDEVSRARVRNMAKRLIVEGFRASLVDPSRGSDA